ncbi:hypothetical protein CKK33_14390 [Mucilaginibacter sp. MD40]|uniref:hypothetical protein n=1 Tax=Mucilaginibacter sp. MD40 TaxID=2029590 RepID=UPI000BAC7993|nr:hypothetical protein [Mucilaginibacter sp. MD40]PAW94614.1 hypothetical protein CKK33_14390 [Mucilaginibacter sp. MD40]
MKNLDVFSKRIMSLSIALGIVLSTASLFVFSLSTISKSYAQPQGQHPVQPTPTYKGYAIVGVYPANGNVYLVGVNEKNVISPIAIFKKDN